MNSAICLFLVAPILVVSVASFSDSAYLVFPPPGISLRWYEYVFASFEFMSGLALSVQLALVSAAIALVSGLAAAVALVSWRDVGAELLQTALSAPLVVPGITAGIAMLIYFNRIGLEGTFISLVLAHVSLTLPYVVRVISAGLQSVDRSLEEAALNLGAGRARAFLTVTLPMIQGSIIAAAMFAFIISFDEVVVTLFLSGPRLMTLPVRIYNYVEYTSDPSIAAISTLLVGITSLVVLVLDRFVGFSRFV